MSDRNDFNAKIIKEFRDNDGLVGGRFKTMRLLLLHTTGAKTGEERVIPLATREIEGNQIIIASNGGSPNHPDWFYNLKANPEVTVELGSETYQAKAIIAEEPKRSDLYDQMADRYPFFNEYQARAERQIPVIRLERRT